MGVIHKATEGTDYIDPMYAGRKDECLASGLMWAGYHFLKHGDIHEQMDHYVSIAGPNTVTNRAIIDFEDPECTLDDLESAVGWLLDWGCEVTVYGNGHLSGTLTGATSPILSRTSLWQARYSSEEPDVPSPWLYWSLWQYANDEEVKGVSEPIDANNWNGNPDKLVEWFNGPAPEPLSELPIVEIKIAADRDIVLYVNGVQITI